MGSVVEAVVEGLLADGGITLESLLAAESVTQARLLYGVPAVRAACCRRGGGKSGLRSNVLREEGNAEFKAGRLRRALARFTGAVVTAPTDDAGKGKELALALANRALCLLRLDEAEAALLDLDLALAAGYPDDSRSLPLLSAACDLSHFSAQRQAREKEGAVLGRLSAREACF
jgi:tetratricopeptide (TPR) repeat protein